MGWLLALQGGGIPVTVVPSSAATPWASPLMLTLLTGLVVSIIGSIAGGIVAVIGAMKLGQVKEQQSKNTDTIATVAKDTEAIKGHVNSERTELVGKNQTLQKENELLREMLADRKTTAALLAQAVASASAQPQATAVPAPSSQ